MKKVYRRWWMATFLDLFICGAGLLVITTIILTAIPKRLSEIHVGQVISVPIASYVFLMIIGLGKQALKYRLELDDKGITSVCWGTVYTTWENLREFGYARFGKNTFIGIVTKQPTSFTQNWYEHLNASHIDFTHFIPLTPIIFLKQKYLLKPGYDWDTFAKTPLGQDLLYHAPHLFEEENIHAKSQG
jgi:hypothetical protein